MEDYCRSALIGGLSSKDVKHVKFLVSLTLCRRFFFLDEIKVNIMA